MESIEGTQLIKAASSGDAEAFTELVRLYRDMVYGYCYHRTGSFEDARDLAQDTFVRAYTSLHQLRDHSKLSAWLRRIAANACARWYERRRETAAEIPDEPEPARQSIASEYVREALSSLPDNEQLAVVLHYVNGYSYSDIAGFLEVSKDAVRGRLYRGREMLKAEVLRMTRDAFDENRLDEKFVVDAVKTAVDEAANAYNELQDKELSRKKTDEAAALVDNVKPDGSKTRSRWRTRWCASARASSSWESETAPGSIGIARRRCMSEPAIRVASKAGAPRWPTTECCRAILPARTNSTRR